MAKVVDGRAIAREIRAQVKERARLFEEKEGRRPVLKVLMVGENEASMVYVRSILRTASKLNIDASLVQLLGDADQAGVEALVRELNENDAIDGIMIQMPLPRHIDAERVVSSMDPAKDVEGVHPMNYGRLVLKKEDLVPCTPMAVVRILEHEGFPLRGAEAVIVNRTPVVGKPLSLLLLHRDATVTVTHTKTRDLKFHTRRADLVVVAVGRPRLFTRDYFSEGVAVVDVGINEVDGKIVGDVDFDQVSEIASLITPVPGGVGPVTTAILMENVVKAAEGRARG